MRAWDFWIVHGDAGEGADLPHALWLLRVHTKRQCRGTAEERYELTSPHCCTQAQGPTLYRLKRVL